MSLPLSKTLDPADYLDLAEELVVVDRHFTKEREQHPARRWEYAMALRAQEVWRATTERRANLVYDIGGAGSPFRYMADADDEPIRVVDPCEPDTATNFTLAQYLGPHCELGDNIFCLSVLEHVDDLPQFLYHLSCLVAPGGLLFLTMDCCGSSHARPIDTAHFHWMRQRIFSVIGVTNDVTLPLLSRDFAFLGEHEHTYGGDQLYGSYSFASLALVKRS